MNTPEQQARTDCALRRAREIIRQEWIEAGKTEEELDQEEQLVDLLDMLIASGRSAEEIHAEWEGKSNAEILHAYTKVDVTTQQHEETQSKRPVTTLATLDNLAACVGQAWQSEKSAVEVLSEMRR